MPGPSGEVVTPAQKPGRSKQDYGTPPELLRAIERAFHIVHWAWDLAADATNSITQDHRFFGPGSTHGEDSFAEVWHTLGGDLWLNNPFADIDPWVAKCQAIRHLLKPAGRIFQLVPAAVGANWFQHRVDGKAHVVFLSPRVTFLNQTAPYPKDLILAVWGEIRGGYSTWRWK